MPDRDRRRLTGHIGRWPSLVAAAVLVCGLATSGCAAFGGSANSANTGKPDKSQGSDSPLSSSPTPSHSASSARADGKPLAGMVVGIDPGHNGLNHTDPAFINKLIWNGRERETCDTTGTETDNGYTEARYNFNVASYLAADLRKDGAKVVLTRHSNDGVGPCVTTRAQILNRAHADVAIDIHADGGPASGRGFTVLEPVADGRNDKVIASSLRFGRLLHAAFLADTPFPISDYYGHDGYIVRNDLAGLNLTTVPKVLIETGNMRNATDARLLTSPVVQRRIARALLAAIVRFLTGHWPAGSGPAG